MPRQLSTAISRISAAASNFSSERVQRNELPDIAGKDDRDAAHRRGAEDGELRPAVHERGELALGLEDVGKDPAGTRQCRRQLGHRERAAESDEPADGPDGQHGARFAHQPRHVARHPEDAAADGGADQHRRGAPRPQRARQALGAFGRIGQSGGLAGGRGILPGSGAGVDDRRNRQDRRGTPDGSGNGTPASLERGAAGGYLGTGPILLPIAPDVQ